MAIVGKVALRATASHETDLSVAVARAHLRFVSRRLDSMARLL